MAQWVSMGKGVQLCLKTPGHDIPAESLALIVADLKEIDAHSARVQQLGERYSRVLVLAPRLKKDLEWSGTLNWVLGGTAVDRVIWDNELKQPLAEKTPFWAN